MSNKPNPVALTAAMLSYRMAVSYLSGGGNLAQVSVSDAYACAALASDLHRLAPACKRQAEADCNGEWRNGQRDAIYARGPTVDKTTLFRELDESIEAYGKRLDRRLAKLNERLAPLALAATRQGDPRGWCLRISSTDAARPVPRNGMSDVWGIA